MLIEYEKFTLPLKGTNKKVFAEVNWNKDDSSTNECKELKFTFPDGTVGGMQKEHLMSLLFAIGSPREQMNMIPQRIIKSRWYETRLGITAKEDIKKGEKIVVHVKIPLPSVTDEVIADVSRRLRVPAKFIEKVKSKFSH